MITKYRLYTESKEDGYRLCLQTHIQLCEGTFTQRQLYVRLVDGMVECHPEIEGLFEDHCLPPLAILVQDPVQNVRLVVARMLRQRSRNIYPPSDLPACWHVRRANIQVLFRHMSGVLTLYPIFFAAQTVSESGI